MTFARLLSEATAASGLPATGDLLSVGLPFLRQLDELHRSGLVSRLRGLDGLEYDGIALRLADDFSQRPTTNDSIRWLNPESGPSGVSVVRRLDLDHGVGHGAKVQSLDVHDGASEPPERPMFVVGYRAWEQLHGHHDVLTDIHLAGMLLVSYAFGLDFDVDESVHEVAIGHRHLGQGNPTLHPVVVGVLAEMISPDRHRRPVDLAHVIARLEHHRELPADLDLDDAYQAVDGWRTGVLTTLRERVFDVSRRNRALYFKPSSTALSLTDASVPLLLDIDRIKPADLLTWTGTAAAAFRSGRQIDLERWCRFEEAPHLAPGLDKLISSERMLRAEHGQGRLRLIVAFLHWVDPDTGEAISSPLVTLSAELTRKRGVRDRYSLRVESEGETSPVLRHVFSKRFGIIIPETVETDHASLVELVDHLQAMVRATDPSIEIDLVETPRVSVIRRRAQQRVDAYIRRRARAKASSGRWRRQDHSYDTDDWRPLGLALYRRFVESAELPMRTIAGAPPAPVRPDALAASGHTAGPGERVQSEYQSSAVDVSRQRWEVDLCSVTLASLGSRRSSLSRDYNALLSGATPLDSSFDSSFDSAFDTPFDAVFSPEPRPPRRDATTSLSVDQVLVLPADDAQARAVHRVLAGESLIIQGPPGTGKSQTIANLIAASVAEGRRVLFVCEKRAALDVVAQRLRQVGLGQLVATIHDSQLDRKSFITDLGSVYANWLADTRESWAEDHDRALASVRELLAPLDACFVELGDERGAQRSVAEIIERLVLLRSRGVGAAGGMVADGLAPGAWLDARPGLNAVADELGRTGRTGPLGTVDVLRIAPASLVDTDPVVAVRELGGRLLGAVEPLVNAFSGSVPIESLTISAMTWLAEQGSTLSVLQSHGMLSVLDRRTDAHHEAQQAIAERDRLIDACEARRSVLDRWHVAPDAADTVTALEIAQAKEHSFFRFLSGTWRQVDSLLKSEYRYELHQIDPPASTILGELLEFRRAEAAVEAQRDVIVSSFGLEDLGPVLKASDRLHDDPVLTVVSRGPALDFAGLEQASTDLLDLDQQLLTGREVSLAQLQQLGTAMSRASVADERALGAWSRLPAVDSRILEAALDSTATLDEIERAVLQSALDNGAVMHSSGAFTGARLDQTIERLLDRYRKLLTANAELVAGRTRQRFLASVAFSEASMAGRSDADKERKRAYRAGRRLLEREFAKKMRFRSIRELASGDSGDVVAELKPIWLMSPLSVSDTLPLDDGLFDVVIFDEASQIPVEDAVPSLFRARQTVIVGDRMQLPPTRFFSTSSDEDEDLVVEDDGQRVVINLDADSFLTQADLALDSTMLTWHYRSRYESLIGYSNHAFYEARLATIPDRTLDTQRRDPIDVDASDEAAANLTTALDRPISFHAMQHGVYEDRRNTQEADYIAEMVRAMLATDVGHTIGVVAFSEAQQAAIETSLAELATLDRRFAEQLEEEQARVDDDEMVGLFIKNLENVQGDERDVIIMSVCYAVAPDGKMRMNFGPINQAGGERRLNVIFSRAKKHMMIVSSIVGRNITNLHNDGAAHLARFLDYAEAESIADGSGEPVLRSLHPVSPPAFTSPSDERTAVATELAEALRSAGHAVDVEVGRSVFSIDVAVRGNGEYSLGILIDPGESASTPTGRLIAEAGVLHAMNWPITRVLVTEWWNDPAQVIDRIGHLVRSERA